MKRISVAVAVFLMSLIVNAEEERLVEGVWKGTLNYSDGTRRNADYHVSTNENNETQIRLTDEEQIEFVFKPILVQKGKVKFLWNPENKESECTLKKLNESGHYQGECHVLNNLSVTLTMRPPAQPADTE